MEKHEIAVQNEEGELFTVSLAHFEANKVSLTAVDKIKETKAIKSAPVTSKVKMKTPTLKNKSI